MYRVENGVTVPVDRIGQTIYPGALIAFAYTGLTVSQRIMVVTKVYDGVSNGHPVIKIKCQFIQWLVNPERISRQVKLVIEHDSHRIIVLPTELLAGINPEEREELLNIIQSVNMAHSSNG